MVLKMEVLVSSLRIQEARALLGEGIICSLSDLDPELDLG